MRSMALISFFFLATSFDALAQQAPQPNAVTVRVVTAERKAITRSLDLVGRIDAIDKVEVRARITGYLEDVLFKEGEVVKQGAPLYRIEKGLFEAAVGQASGALEKDKAAKALADIQLQRADDLLAKGTGTQVARDQAFAAVQTANGALMISESNLQTAKINLSYTEIASPITGQISKSNITKGNVVSPQSGILTTIVSEDPIYVTFPVSQREFIPAQRENRGVDVAGVKAKLYFSDGSPYKHEGKITFIDVTVDRGTDTVLARATFPNPDGVLLDGQLARIGLESGSKEERIVIPQAALIADQEGVYVFIVDQGKAAIRRLHVGGASGSGIIVEEGLAGGEQVIVEGLQSIRRGAPVKAIPLGASDRS